MSPSARVSLCLGLALIACGREPGGDALRAIPADVRVAAVAPSLANLQVRAAGFIGSIEGAGGALDLLADRYGFDLRTAEGPEPLGLDVERGVAVFERQGAFVAVASVDEPERFLRAVHDRLAKGAGAKVAAGQPADGADLQRGAAWVMDGDGWRAALGVTLDRVGVLVVAPPAIDVVGAWNAVAAVPAGAGFMASDKARAARATIGEGAVVYLALEDLLPDAPSGLGLVRGVAQSMIDALPLFTGGLAVSDDALSLKLAADHVGDGALPVSWVTAPGTPEALARAFPKTTTAFVRFRVALANVRALPGFLRESVLPDRLPGLEALPIPSVSDLIDLLEGDVAVGLLGLDAGANLGQLAFLPRHPERALTLFHAALAAKMRDPAATRRAFAGIASQLETSGWAVAPIVSNGPDGKPGPAGYAGWSFAKEQARYAVLLDDQIVVFVIGAGEVAELVAVKEGRALSLASYADGGSDTVKAALGQGDRPPTPFGLALGPLRLLRELQARGLPPYFLKIINDVRLLSASVGTGSGGDAGGAGGPPGKRLELALEVAL